MSILLESNITLYVLYVITIYRGRGFIVNIRLKEKNIFTSIKLILPVLGLTSPDTFITAFPLKEVMIFLLLSAVFCHTQCFKIEIKQ